MLWPANTHFHALIAGRARGGTLLTGFGGDEAMSPGWEWDRATWVLARRRRPRPSDVQAVLAAQTEINEAAARNLAEVSA